MQLFKLPFLVQKELFQSMEFFDLIMLSICSKRVKRTILQFKQYLFKDIKAIRYGTYDKVSSVIRVSTEVDDWKMLVSFSPENLILFRAFLDGKLMHHLNIFGMRLRCSMRPDYIEVTADESNIKFLIQSFHHLLFDFLGNSVEYQVCVQENGFLPMLKHVKKTEINVRQNPGATDLEEYFTCSPKQEHLYFRTWANIELRPKLKMFDTKHLNLSCLGQPLDQILIDFNGQSLFIERTSIKESTIIQFVNQWKLNQKYQNLDFVFINISQEFLKNPFGIIRRLGVKQNKVAEYQPAYYFKKRDGLMYNRTYSLEFSSRIYVVNESSGHVATLTVKTDKFIFTNWRMTEEEFLVKRPNRQRLIQ